MNDIKTYYVVFERQGYEELCVKVEAKTEEEAKNRAREVMLQRYDVYTRREEPQGLDCLTVDENGEEV